MGGGISVINQSNVPVLFILSQLTPRYWIILQPNESRYIHCDRVWCTACCEFYDGGHRPNKIEVAKRFVNIYFNKKEDMLNGIFTDGNKTIVIDHNLKLEII